MFTCLKKLSLCSLLALGCLFGQKLYAKRISFGSTKSYTKKAPYAGLGKTSKVNRLPKTKTISGHGKRTCKGYTYVNPYARSK